MKSKKRKIILVTIALIILILATYIFCNLYAGCKKSNRKITVGTYSAQNFELGELNFDDFELTIKEKEKTENTELIFSDGKYYAATLSIRALN